MKALYCVRTGEVLAVLLAMCLFACGEAAKADFVFGEATKISNVNSSSADLGPSISADGLELYFASNRNYGGDMCYGDIWVAKRATTDDEWGEPVNLGLVVNSAGPEFDPSISADGLELYFSEGYPHAWRACGPRAGGYGAGDLWVSRREAPDADWGTPINLGPEINSASYDDTPSISVDGLSLFFTSARPGGYGECDLYVTTRPSRDDPWGPVANIGPPVNTFTFEVCPQVSPDGLTLFFTRSPYLSDSNIFVSKRVNSPARPRCAG